MFRFPVSVVLAGSSLAALLGWFLVPVK